MILIKNAKLVDPLSEIYAKKDILINDEKIEKIADNIDPTEDVQVIDGKDLFVSPGFIDIHVHFREPGFTEKETIYTGSKSAAAGGYTTVVNMANTKPIVDSEEVVEFIKEKSKSAVIEVLQTSAVTKNFDGETLVDFEKMKDLGVVGFTDDGIPLMNPQVLKEAMEEVKKLDMPISLHEEDPRLIKHNGINKYSNALAENVLVARDIVIALETQAKLNIQHISSKVSVELVRWAKKMGANVTSEVTPHHFSLTEEAVDKYGSNAKMNPPLREESDLEAIIEGLKDGTIDIIATDHAPHTKEEKDKELTKAPSGIIGLETAFALAITNLYEKGHLSLMEIIEKLTINPAKLYNLDRGYIKEGHRADLVIFSIDEKFNKSNFYSKSNNTPFKDIDLKGKIKYTISNGEIVFEDK